MTKSDVVFWVNWWQNILIWQTTTCTAKYWRELMDVACTFFLPRPYWIIELFLLNILDIFSGKNLMKKNIWHFIIFGKMNGPNQTPLPLTPGRLKVLPMGLCYIKACFYWKIGRASKTNSNKLCCVLLNLKPKVRPYNVHIMKKYLIQRFLHTSRSFVSIGILILPML